MLNLVHYLMMLLALPPTSDLVVVLVHEFYVPSDASRGITQAVSCKLAAYVGISSNRTIQINLKCSCKNNE